MAELRFDVLGPLRVVVDGRERQVPAGRRRTVLARLLVDVGAPVSADALIDAAWPTTVPQNPDKALRTVLSRLRSVVGRETVQAGPTGYRLGVAPSAVDAVEFERLVGQANNAAPDRSRNLLAGALALWRGAAFQEFADAPFAAPAAARLGRLRADAVEAYSEQLQQVDPAAAVDELERLLADEPYRERAVELLARTLYLAGRQTEALHRLRAYRAQLAEELGLDPSPSVAELEQDLLGHTVPRPARASTGPPAWMDTSTAFIGREDDLAGVLTAVADGPLAVVTGPGGVGKSRLAAEALLMLHRDGLPVTVIELAGVPPGRAMGAVADAFGVHPSDAEPDEQLVEYLAAVPALIMLDNCEHLLDEIRPLVSGIVRRCRQVRVLATSRRRLGIPSERVIPLAPLTLPDPDADVGSLGTAASVRLFADRVRRLRPAFAVTPDGAAAVAELCRRCDGLPLALELAASRAAAAGVDEALNQLPAARSGRSLDGLDAVVEWSTRLLGRAERYLLQQLSVFAGAFTADDVRGLTERLAWWSGDPAPALAELVESCLVELRVSGSSCRYRLLEMVRAHAGRRLAESGRADEARRAHAAWLRETVTAVADDWVRVDGAVVGARLTGCSTEISAALRWALAAGELSIAVGITNAVGRCLHWTPGLELGEQMIEVAGRCAADGRPSLAAGVAVGAFLVGERGDTDRAIALAQRAMAMSGRSAASAATVPALLALAVSAMYSSDHTASRRWFSELATIPPMVGEANSSLALIACYADDLPAAREHVRIALDATGVGGDATRAFATYAAGEVQARTDASRGTDLLTAAAAEADRVGAEQVGRVARVALFALLVRGGRRGDAAALGVRLIDELRRHGGWNQAWTMMRLLAELLAASERWPDAAFLLAATDAAASPPPVGTDVPRYAALRAQCKQRLGGAVTGHIGSLAAATPRAQVLSRAERMLSLLSGQGEQP